MSTRHKIAKVFAKKKAQESPDMASSKEDSSDNTQTPSPVSTPKRSALRDKDGPFHLLLNIKERDKNRDTDKDSIASVDSPLATQPPGSPSLSVKGLQSKVSSIRHALHIPSSGSGSNSKTGSLKSENDNVLSQMTTPSGAPWKKPSTVPKASEVFPRSSLDQPASEKPKHEPINIALLETEFNEYQKAIGILFQRLEHIKEKSNEEFLEVKQYLDSEWQKQPLTPEKHKDMAAAMSKFDFCVKKWLMLPTSDFDANIVKEIVYEVQKIQEMWVGPWKLQNFAHKMILLIGQTTPIIENLKLEPKELKAVFDKAKKPKEDPSVEIDRDIYSEYWSGTYKEVQRNADSSTDEINGLIRCRICDDLLPSTLLESHSQICVQISKWEMELESIDDTLRECRTKVTATSLDLLRMDAPSDQDRKDIKMLQELDHLIQLGLDYLSSDTIFESRTITSFSLKYLPLDKKEATTSFYDFAKKTLETVQKKIEIAQKGLKATQDIVKIKKIRPREALQSLLPSPAPTERRSELKRTKSIASAYNRKTRVANLNEKLSHRPNRENRKVRKALNVGIKEDEEESGDAVPTSQSPPTWGMRNNKSSIQDFRIVKIISRGAYGRVFLAQKKSTGDYYAIKVLRKKEMLNRSQLDHVKAEQSILAQLNHTFVVKLYYSFESEENLYLVMEYLSGGDLFSLLKNVGCLTEEWSRMYIAELVHALDYLHSKDIVHRDLKPDNLLIGSDGHLKLTDFGLSKIGLMNKTNQWSTMSTVVLSEKAQRTSTALNLALLDISEQNDITMALVSHVENVKISGTPDYLAPETIMGIGYGPAVDFWAVGAILYELIVGIPPFNAETPQEVFENILSKRLIWPEDISDTAKDLIDRLLTLDHTKRLGSGGSIEVKSHPFFEGIDWDALLSQEAIFIPKPSNIEDTAYFEMKSSHRTQSIIHIEDELSGRAPLNQTFQSDGVFGKFHYKNIEFLESANLDMIKKVNRTVRLSMKKGRPRTHSSPNKIDSPKSLKKVMYCLIASPNPVAARSIQNWVKRRGILSSICTNGIDAARFALEKKTYDIIFLDLSLPDLNGLEVAQLIRAEDCANQNTKIVLFTAIMDDAEAFKNEGLECYLQGGLMKSNLESMMETWSPESFLAES